MWLCESEFWNYPPVGWCHVASCKKRWEGWPGCFFFFSSFWTPFWFWIHMIRFELVMSVLWKYYFFPLCVCNEINSISDFLFTSISFYRSKLYLKKMSSKKQNSHFIVHTGIIRRAKTMACRNYISDLWCYICHL